MPAVGHLLDGEDVAQLSVLVRLGADEALAVDHRTAVAITVEAGGEASHVAEVRARGHLTGEGVGVRRHRADDAQALVDAHVVRLDEILKEKVGEEEVAEVGHADGLLEAVLGVGGLHGVGEVDGRVADERLELLGELGSAAKLLREVTHGLEVAELELHHGVGVGGEAELLGLGLALGDVAHRHDHVVVAAVDERLGGVEAETGGGAGDDGGLLARGGVHGEDSLGRSLRSGTERGVERVRDGARGGGVVDGEKGKQSPFRGYPEEDLGLVAVATAEQSTEVAR